MDQVKNSVVKFKHSVRNVSLGRKLYLAQPLHSVWNASILQHTGRIPNGMRCFVACIFYRAIILNRILFDIHTITQ